MPQCRDPALLSAPLRGCRGAGLGQQGMLWSWSRVPALYPPTSHPLVLLEGSALLSAAGRPALGRPAPRLHPGETQPARPAHCSQLGASAALNQQEPWFQVFYSSSPALPPWCQLFWQMPFLSFSFQSCFCHAAPSRGCGHGQRML